LCDLPEFDVRYSDELYNITPLTPFTDGGHYRFSLIDDSISFHGESPSVRTLDFRIYKEPVEVVELRDDIKYIYWNDAIILDSGAYYVPVSSAVSKGEIICFWDGEINDNSRFFNVLLASPPSDIDGRPMVLLTVEESKVTEILEDLNVHFSDKMLMSDQLVGIDTDEIAEEARNSQGTRQLTSLLACAISQSTTFNDLLSLSGITSAYVSESMADGEQFLPIEENDEDKIEFPLEIMSQVINQALEQDLTVSAYVTTSQNSNFFNAGPDDWTTMSLTFTYNTIIKNKISIRATFTVTESIKSTAQGDAWVDDDEYTIEDFFSENIIPDMYFDFAINNYSQTDFDLSVLIKTVDTTDSDYIDITKELEEMTKPGSESDAASFLEEILGSKGDYITLLDIPLITLVYPIIQECPVLQLNVDLNFVVKVNFAAGISSHATVMSAKQAGISGDTITGVDTYQNTLIGNNRYTFDFYCAGYLGFKAGIKLSFSLSVYGLPGLGKVGFSGEVGAYLDIYGFMHLNISKLQQYSDQKDVSLQGGLYMELGIYVELKAFAKSDWFKVKASASLYEDKFPLLEIGYQYVLLRFLDESSSVIINEDQFPLYGNAGLLDAEYIDMKTGKIVQSSEIDMSKIISNFAISFSSPYFEYSDDDYTFRVLKENFGVHYDSLPYVSPQATRLDITIYVYYTGGNLAFSNRNGQDTMKQIELIWIDPGIDISGNPDLNAVKATYVADIDGTEYPIAEKWLPFGDIPGSIDYSPYVTGSKFIGYTNDPTQPIYEDTTYTLHLKRYQQLVSYITYHGDSWHFDVYAANVGEVPVQPEDYDSSGNNLVFKGWIGIPGSSYANLGVTNTVSEIISDSTYMDIDSNNIVSIWSPSGDYVYSDLDTTKPLFSASGSYDDCIGYYYSGFFREAPFYKCSQYLYEAQYDGGPFTVTLNYPALSYSYM
ncbi:MAG TPA: hypothetical protein PLH18_06485, partial [Clostridia bacterium]|nr:hypothetical protein [Clostridia bacterium]